MQPAIDPAIVNDYAERGRALLAAGHDAAALEAFQRAAWMSPDDPRLHWAVGNVLWRLGRGEEAVASYQRVIELLPDEAARAVTWPSCMRCWAACRMPNSSFSTPGRSRPTTRTCTWPMP